MLTRPTVAPSSVRMTCRVFGRRHGHLRVVPGIQYTAHVVPADAGLDPDGDGEVVVTATLSPTSLRQRRHLGGGIMVACDQGAERSIVDFVSWWPGGWEPDGYRLALSAELEFLVNGLPRMQAAGIRLDVEPGLTDDLVSPEALRLQARITVKGDALLLRADVTAGDCLVSPHALARAAAVGQPWVSADGRAVAIPDGVDAGVLAAASERVVVLPRTERARVASALSLVRDAQIDPAGFELLRQLLYGDQGIGVPDTLRATLKPYQVDGVEWIKRHLCSGAGCVLADDMGTGKTLSSIAAILSMKKVDPSYRAIVVTRSGLVRNWIDEISRFAPSLEFAQYEGAKRKEYVPFLRSADVVITSYATVRIELATLDTIPFHLAIFDEAQDIRNAETALHRAVAALPAATRLALTGTPIENRLEDIHAIFAVACPGLLPPLDEFKEKIVKPFRAGDPDALAELKQTVYRYILRRTKDQVLKDLPPKTILDRFCPMTDAQRRLYEQAKEDARRELADPSMTVQQKSAVVLKALNRLRQIANDPRLGSDALRYQPGDSGKLLELRSMMDTLDADDTNKVLIFSQWVEALELVKQELEARGMEYAMLTGSTGAKDVQIHKFRSRRECRYFLISLKAGGAGLNLVEANYVIQLDPWWNPAAEAQAFDRAHRIGQQRPVTVYRMVSEGTIEEKIVRMKRLKQATSDSVIDDGEIPEPSLAEKISLLDD